MNVWTTSAANGKIDAHRVREKLEALQSRMAMGKLKAAEKIGAVASHLLSGKHGFRYHDWKLQDGQFTGKITGRQIPHIQSEEQNL
jgi:hypothetical protein